ncbi:actin-like protein 6B [Nematocida sp. AWRm77]|nr:actin-like protein 6B [Nematocida sp. AWRm77]
MNTLEDTLVHITDIGHESCKGGYAGAELPAYFERRNNQAYEDALSYTLSYITNESEHAPLINIEDPFTSKETRKKAFVHLMESSLCSGLLFMNGAVTDCFSYGKSTGLMIRLGGESTQVIPVIDGYCISGGLKSSRGGEDITKFAREKLLEKSRELNTDLMIPQIAIEEKKRVALEQLPEYKEKPFYSLLSEEKKYGHEMEVARCFKESVSFIGHCQPKYYEFSSGFTTRIFSERNALPERLFSSEGVKIDMLDPHKQITESVGEITLLEMIKTVLDVVDLEYYDMLLGNIMVSGGGALIPGIGEHLQAELMKMFPNSRVKVSNDKREFSTFFGSSILGSLSTVKTLMITKGEYAECGASALERKRSEWIK